MEDFSQKLVLTEYLYEKFGAESFEEFREALNDADEGFKADNRSQFVERLTADLEPTEWLWERIEQYDQNISEYEKRLAENREESIRLKYFQYLSILFTEIYLDLYFNHKEKLRTEFASSIEQKRAALGVDDLYPLEESNLSKLAYWMATGSGKTLIMHTNLWQFQQYTDENFDNVLLITPNEGLTSQHLEEFELSGIEANRFQPDRNAGSGASISVLDIHKISDETGEKTYSVNTFEGDNLVFVDEGHKGAQGDIWIKYREQVIGDDGFSFEYSATFGQALSSIDNEQLQNRYVQSIIFDYSFRNFHVDGFGKEYDILNLSEERGSRRDKYMTANLLSFYEQKKYYSENQRALEPFNLEDPLWIFVGQTVNAVSGRTITKGDKASDVETVVMYLARFLRERGAIINEIDDILSNTEFLDEEGRNLFEDQFRYLKGSHLSPEAMYEEILERVFNASQSAELTAVRLKNADGEIGLRVGNDGDYFGLVSIGASRKFIDRIEENTQIATEEQEFKRSLFDELDTGASDTNVLIGAKKFTEGWDSYRVSSMGLMRVGRSEGSEIIQIFGRGIRLRGMNNSLKRTSYLDVSNRRLPEHIEILERLNVFGIKADYIKEFEEQLEKEDIPTEFIDRTVETEVNSDLVNNDLKVPRIRDNLNFGAATTLQLSVSEAYAPSIDLYPKIQTLRSSTTESLSESKNKVRSEHLETEHVDWNQIRLDLIKYKERSGYFNMILDIDRLQEVVFGDYFLLKCPESRLNVNGPVEAKEETEEIVRIILRAYIDNVYSAKKADWEDRRRKYESLGADDAELNFDLKFRVPDDPDLLNTVENIISSNPKGSKYKIDFERSLYEPLFIKEKIEAEDSGERLKAPAQALNSGEQKLIQELDRLCKMGRLDYEELYLLRNPRNRGIGFEEGGYPDFILWIQIGDKQKILFLDPHGMIFEPSDVGKISKVKLSNRVSELEQELNDPQIQMYSYVISVTEEEELRRNADDFNLEEYEKNNVYFQDADYMEKILRDAGVSL